MNFRRPITVLVYILPVLVVAFGVLMGGFSLSQATDDQVGASLYWRVAMICLMLLVGNIVLLVGVLGIDALNRSDREADERSGPQDTVS